MNDKMLEIISILNGTADDIDKIENKNMATSPLLLEQERLVKKLLLCSNK